MLAKLPYIFSFSNCRYKIKSALWVKSEKFKCAVCGKVLSCKGELSSKELTPIGDSVEFCLFSGSYDRHIRMHEDNKPFKCSYCGKGFREACKRTVHERIHAGSKPFPCNLCSKSFRTSTQRMVHQRSHTKVSSITLICSNLFSFPSGEAVQLLSLWQSVLAAVLGEGPHGEVPQGLDRSSGLLDVNWCYVAYVKLYRVQYQLY